ncbi:MAG: hypothetical protein M1817_002600 [Caeruleum heppii]|nr:MAG: hypothetical protein M1817_002600 [Caeruleum heppii]
MAKPLSPAQLDYMKAHINEDRGPRNIAVFSALIAVASLAVILRFISRFISTFRVWWDDFFCVLGLLTACASAGDTIYQAHVGVGKHVIAVPKPNLAKINRAAYIVQILYPLTLSFTKLSIVFLYWRLFPTKRFRIMLMVVGGIIVAWCLEVLLVSVFQCSPPRYLWDKTGQGRCLDLRGPFSIANAPPNIGIDVILLAMPIGKIWRLQLDRRSKIGLSFIFLLGSFVIFCSALRLYYLATLDFAGDSTWNQATFHIWQNAEPLTAVICACLLTYKPLISKGKHTLKSRMSHIRSANKDTESGTSREHITPLAGKSSDDQASREPGPDDPTESALKGSSSWENMGTRATYELHTETAPMPRNGLGPAPSATARQGIPLDVIEVKKDVTWNENKPAQPTVRR